MIFNADRSFPIQLIGDPNRLGQVLLNLTDNAIKFTESGEVMTELIDTHNDIVQIQFSVQDTGIRLTENQLFKLFQPFTQADGSITRKYGGTGLGLAISKQLVELMGGDIWAESRLGKGSAFSFKVTTANSGKAVIGELELTDKTSTPYYELIIVSHQILDMSGIDLAKQIKNDSRFSRIPIIMLLPALSGKKEIKQVSDAGIEDYIIKAVNRNDLFNTILRCVYKREISKNESDKKSIPISTLTQGLKNPSVLLVEDNQINQQRLSCWSIKGLRPLLLAMAKKPSKSSMKGTMVLTLFLWISRCR